MCGICGIYNLDNRPIDLDHLQHMTDIIRHRGPDDEGYLLIDTVNGTLRNCHGKDTILEISQNTHDIHDDFPATLGLGFRQLSILDLSSKSHQPMSNDDGSLWIVFNGEIYNYIEIREELIKLGFRFRSNTDTEVILKAYEQWGVECLQKFNGMWSFALYDQNLKKLFCARDRFGVKPFFYYFDHKTLLFGSEIKQILVNDIDKSLNYNSIQTSFYNDSLLVNSKETFFEKIKILPHSHFLIIENHELKIERYYDLPIHDFDKSQLSFEDACSQYKETFKDSIALRIRSDVEVGSTLSGGLDSSAIVTVAAGFTTHTFKTFSSYFDYSPKYDERKWIHLVNERTKARGYLISPPVSDFIADFEKMTWHHDYPLQGSSPMAQYYVMKLVLVLDELSSKV